MYFENNPKWKTTNYLNITDLLIGFFDFLINYPFQTHVVSIKKGKKINKHKFPHFQQLICVQDPFEIDFNTTRLISQNTYNRIKFEAQKAFVNLIEGDDIKVIF